MDLRAPRRTGQDRDCATSENATKPRELSLHTLRMCTAIRATARLTWETHDAHMFLIWTGVRQLTMSLSTSSSISNGILLASGSEDQTETAHLRQDVRGRFARRRETCRDWPKIQRSRRRSSPRPARRASVARPTMHPRISTIRPRSQFAAQPMDGSKECPIKLVALVKKPLPRPRLEMSFVQ
jgi:hypothetical protein